MCYMMSYHQDKVDLTTSLFDLYVDRTPSCNPRYLHDPEEVIKQLIVLPDDAIVAPTTTIT